MPIGNEMPHRNVCKLIYPSSNQQLDKGRIAELAYMDVYYRVKGDSRIDLGDIMVFMGVHYARLSCLLL